MTPKYKLIIDRIRRFYKPREVDIKLLCLTRRRIYTKYKIREYIIIDLVANKKDYIEIYPSGNFYTPYNALATYLIQHGYHTSYTMKT